MTYASLEPFFNLFGDERVAIGMALLLLAAAIGFGIWFWLVNLLAAGNAWPSHRRAASADAVE